MRFPEFEGEWKESTLRECGSGFDYGMNASSKQYDGKNKYIRITDIDERTSEYKSDSIVSPDAEIDEHYRVKTNDILFARTGASTGKTYIYNPNDGNLYFAGFLIRMHVSLQNDARFIFYQTQTKHYKKWVKIMSMRSGQPGINSQEYSSYHVCLPEKKEQLKISGLLSLIDQRISIQNKVIEDLKMLKSTIRAQIVKELSYNWIPLSTLIENGTIALKRGHVIPKKEKSSINIYPVYSSSVVDNGLMGYNDTYMYDDELVSWSIDGGGNFFYRPPHKFNITNVSGVIQANKSIWDYRFISEMLIFQHSHLAFDYQSKAHPSVIQSLYSLPDISLEKQKKVARLFEMLENQMAVQIKILSLNNTLRQYLLQKLFI